MLAWSSAGVLQRALGTDTATQVAGRSFFAAVALLAFVAVTERGRVRAAFRGIGAAGLGFAACMAVSSAAFVIALNHTTVANVLFLQAVSPIIAAVLARAFLGERVSRSTWIAMTLALAGVALMVGGPDGFGLGVGVACVMTFGFAAGVVLARHRPEVSMMPATCLSQIAVVLAFAPFADAGSLDARDTGLLATLGVGQIGLGLVFLALGAQLVPAAEVALISLLEVVLGPLSVWLAHGEEPAGTTIAGGVVVVAAVALQTLDLPERLRRRRAGPRAAPAPTPAE